MKKIIVKYAWCAYLGAAINIVNVSFTDWEWWVICIPTIILVTIYKHSIIE